MGDTTIYVVSDNQDKTPGAPFPVSVNYLRCSKVLLGAALLLFLSGCLSTEVEVDEEDHDGASASSSSSSSSSDMEVDEEEHDGASSSAICPTRRSSCWNRPSPSCAAR